jgi:hypothetical protein
MKVKQEADIYAGNVAIVQSHDVNSLVHPAVFTQGYFDSVGDTNGTIEVKGLYSEAAQESPALCLRMLFGSWVESGCEDKQLDELYKSRLIPSSMPEGNE